MYMAKSLKNDLHEVDWVGRLLLPLLLLFPILSLSVRHWLSGIFSLIVLLALVFAWTGREKLYKEEKALFIIFALFIASFIISATLNGWTESSIRRIGTEFKFVMFFPLYLLIRRYPQAIVWLVSGIVIGAVVLGLQAIYDTFFTRIGRGNGIYGPIIFGDLAVLFAAISAIVLRYASKKTGSDYLFYGVAILLGLLAGYFSGSRNAWLAAIILFLLLPFLVMEKIKIRKLLISYAVVAVIGMSLVFLGPEKLVKRADIAVQEYSQYTGDSVDEGELFHSSIGFRLEQWRVALELFTEKPIFGFGAGNAGREINRYVKSGLAHPDLYNEHAYHGITGVHSTYFEVLVTEGIVGLAIVGIMLLYPMYIFFKSRGNNPMLSSVGVVFMSGYAIFALTENPFVHDNFASMYLVLLAVIFSRAIHEKYSSRKSGGFVLPSIR